MQMLTDMGVPPIKALQGATLWAAESIGQGLAFELKALGALKTFPHISNFPSLTGWQTSLQTCG